MNNTTRNNQAYRAARRSRTAAPSDAAATGDLSAAARRASARAGSAKVPAGSASRRRSGAQGKRGAASGARTASTNGRTTRSKRSTSFMKYASDNRLVRAIYDFTTGPSRHIFYALVIIAVGIGVYFPLRDLYIAHRVNDILEQQLAIRREYNDSLEKEVDQYLSKEGIEAAAREQGMVMPGEQTITVEGLDENGDPIVKPAEGEDGAPGNGGDQDGAQADANANGAKDGTDPGHPKTSAEAEHAEQAVFENSPWYYKLLDALFFFDDPAGQTVLSSGGAKGSGEDAQE